MTYQILSNDADKLEMSASTCSIRLWPHQSDRNVVEQFAGHLQTGMCELIDEHGVPVMNERRQCGHVRQCG